MEDVGVCDGRSPLKRKESEKEPDMDRKGIDLLAFWVRGETLGAAISKSMLIAQSKQYLVDTGIVCEVCFNVFLQSDIDGGRCSCGHMITALVQDDKQNH